MKRFFFFILLGALLSALTACATEPTETAKEMRRALEEGTGQPGEPPPEVSAALIPPISINLPGVEPTETEQRFDVRVRRVPARDFFLGLVDGTPYSVVVPPDFSGSITLDLKNVTVPEVMDVVRRTHGYEYERSDRTYNLLPERLHSRVFHVDYLDLKRSGLSTMLASPGEVSRAGSSGGSQTTGGEGSFSRINTESTTEFWPGITAALKQMVGDGGGRNVSVNSQSGVIMVRAMPSELRAVREFLDAAQARVQRQVVLEARILEVALSDGFQSGINWAALGSRNNDTALAGQFGGSTIFNSGASNLQNQTNVLNPNDLSGVRADVTTAFGGMFALALDTGDFTAFIEMLKTQGEVQVLSSPRVSTVNNQKAVIKVGSDEFFVTNLQSTPGTATAAGNTQPTVNVELTPFFSGVALDVTPQISREGEVILHMHPSVSEVREQVKNINAGTAVGTLTLPLAASTIRESDSVVRARDGQVVVIGGLMQTREQDEQAAVPFFSRIPILGNLFKHTRKTKRKSELVILLKPVVATTEVWADEIERASPTIRKMGGGGL